MDVWLWIFLNVGVALSPLAAIAVAMQFHKKDWSLAALLGDGFLFFFTITLATGLVTDAAKALERASPKVTLGLFVSVIIGALVLVAGAWLSYCLALIRRFAPQADQGGKGFAIASLLFSLPALILTIWIRQGWSLW